MKSSSFLPSRNDCNTASANINPLFSVFSAADSKYSRSSERISNSDLATPLILSTAGDAYTLFAKMPSKINPLLYLMTAKDKLYNTKLAVKQIRSTIGRPKDQRKVMQVS